MHEVRLPGSKVDVFYYMQSTITVSHKDMLHREGMFF